MSRIQWEAESEYRMACAELDAAQQELSDVWALLHLLVEKTRGTYEMNCPAVYAKYEEMCEIFKEKPRQVKIELI